MGSFNLPILLSNDIFILPGCVINVEFDDNILINNICDVSEAFHNNNLVFAINDCSIGVICEIVCRMKLPNDLLRIELKGLRRVEILNYLYEEQIASECVCIELVTEKINKEEVYLYKLVSDLEKSFKYLPMIDEIFLEGLNEVTDLSLAIDMVCLKILKGHKYLSPYLVELNVLLKYEMILKEIQKLKNVGILDEKLDAKILKQLDDFHKNYIIKEKIKLMQEEINEDPLTSEFESMKEKINSLKCNKTIKSKLLYELNRYENIPSISPESAVLKEYIDLVVNLPFNVFSECNSNIKEVKKAMDVSHYGLSLIKDRVLEYLAVSSVSNSKKMPVLCLVGPPGVGKTSLVKCIAECLNRSFIKISVGGLKDETELIGHRKTYIGAMPGRIINGLIRVKNCNPVILIDEIDKMGTDYMNNPANCLLNILDSEQNSTFSDNYVEEEFDLSNVLFITTANYIEDIPEALVDRLEIVEIDAYTDLEKFEIVKNYLLLDVCMENGLDVTTLNLSDYLIKIIITKYTRECGIRELKRQLSKLVRKIVTQKVMLNIELHKIDVTEKDLISYLGAAIYDDRMNCSAQIGCVNGLAFTAYGGSVLRVECAMHEGSAKLNLTGSLGEVMKESAQIALSFLRVNCDKFGIDVELFNNDIHIHFPEGAIRKDGPSAGVGMTLGLFSLFTGKIIDYNIALTGEITLCGDVIKIGGLKQKCMGAIKSGITKVFIPYDNLSEIISLPKEIQNELEFIGVKNFFEIYEYIK